MIIISQLIFILTTLILVVTVFLFAQSEFEETEEIEN